MRATPKGPEDRTWRTRGLRPKSEDLEPNWDCEWEKGGRPSLRGEKGNRFVSMHADLVCYVYESFYAWVKERPKQDRWDWNSTSWSTRLRRSLGASFCQLPASNCNCTDCAKSLQGEAPCGSTVYGSWMEISPAPPPNPHPPPPTPSPYPTPAPPTWLDPPMAGPPLDSMIGGKTRRTRKNWWIRKNWWHYRCRKGLCTGGALSTASCLELQKKKMNARMELRMQAGFYCLRSKATKLQTRKSEQANTKRFANTFFATQRYCTVIFRFSQSYPHPEVLTSMRGARRSGMHWLLRTTGRRFEVRRIDLCCCSQFINKRFESTNIRANRAFLSVCLNRNPKEWQENQNSALAYISTKLCTGYVLLVFQLYQNCMVFACFSFLSWAPKIYPAWMCPG